jgi:hypothetical protein
MQMSAFAARANAVLPPALAARLAFQQGRASKSRTMSSKAVPEGLSDGCKGAPVPEGVKLPIMADESVMAPKAHGTTETPVQQNLRWNCEWKTADKICSFNRHYAEYAGYWESTNFLEEVDREKETTYYDSVSGKPLFIAPRGRSFEDFAERVQVARLAVVQGRGGGLGERAVPQGRRGDLRRWYSSRSQPPR